MHGTIAKQLKLESKTFEQRNGIRKNRDQTVWHHEIACK